MKELIQIFEGKINNVMNEIKNETGKEIATLKKNYLK